MKITIRAKPGAKANRIEDLGSGVFVVSVTERPVEGKSNLAIIELLSEYFDVPKSNVKIISGHTSKQKIIEIIK